MEIKKLDYKKEKIQVGDLFINNNDVYYVKYICKDKSEPFYGFITITNTKDDYSLEIFVNDLKEIVKTGKYPAFILEDFYFGRIIL